MNDTTFGWARTTFESGNPNAGAWSVVNLTLTEALNEPYSAVVDLATTDTSLDPALLLGENAILEMIRGPLVRRVVGIVERVEHGVTGRTADVHESRARVHVVPALAALKQVVDTRIFQAVGEEAPTVPEILEEILGEALGVYGRSVNVDDLAETYAPREICLQYRESTFDFVHRLMEEEGIGYRFLFDGDVEELVLSDGNGAFPQAETADDQPVPFLRAGGARGEGVFDLRGAVQLVPTHVVVRAFDWRNPAVPIEDERPANVEDRHREIYDHGRELRIIEQSGSAFGPTGESRQAVLHRELHTRDERVLRGAGHASGFRPGVTFELIGHDDPALDGPYLLTRVRHGTRQDGEYSNEFECLPAEVPWRPARVHRKPHIHSVQTAVVVGQSEQEILTDEDRRIRVQFHWDRQGASDDKSMCWLRVNQTWAGPGWGFQFVPRIGMEVVVSFVHGDPDRPVVTGCLYNGDHEVPYPNDKTKSTIKSNSSLGGGGFNELRLEDLAGSEEVFLHAQKDLNEEVLNDHNTHVGNSQTITVDSNQTQTIHGNQTEQVDTSQELTVNGARTVHVKGSFTEDISGSETRTVTSGMTETISGGQTRTVNGDLTETINGGETRTVNGGLTETIDGDVTHTFNTSSMQTVTGARSVTVTGDIRLSTDATYERVAVGGAKLTAEAGHTVLAPGGQQAVDAKYELYGQNLQWSYACQLRAVINVQQTFVKRQAFRGLDKRVTVFKVDIINSVAKNKPIKKKKAAATLMGAGVVAIVAGFMILG